MGGCGHACGLDLAEDVEDDHAADVKQTDHHDGLGLELPAGTVLAEVGELVSLAVSAALASAQWRAFALLLRALLHTLACAFLG